MIAARTDLDQTIGVWPLPFVAKPQDDIRRGKLFTCPVDTDLFDRLRAALPHAGRVDEQKGYPAQSDRHLDHVARGSGNIRNDRRFALDQSIEQCRLAAIRGTTEHHPHTIAQLFRSGPRQEAAHFLDQPMGRILNHRLLRRRDIILVGKIQLGLYPCR